jgi:cation transport ATPase
MTHTYTVTGMTCNNCIASIEKHLKSIDKVDKISIDLDTAEVHITMSAFISTEVFKAALPHKYSLSEKGDHNKFAPVAKQKVNEKSKLIQLFPLFLIFGYITIGAVLMNNEPFNIQRFMLDFMGLFFIVFSFFKLLDLKGFRESFKMYDPLAKILPAYGWVYPFLELSLGILFLMRIQIPLALIMTLIILGITTIGVSKTLLTKKAIQCACLGTVLKLPMTKATFIENSIMIAMAIFMLLTTYN